MGVANVQPQKLYGNGSSQSTLTLSCEACEGSVVSNSTYDHLFKTIRAECAFMSTSAAIAADCTFLCCAVLTSAFPCHAVALNLAVKCTLTKVCYCNQLA
jgi:hypothetical protein